MDIATVKVHEHEIAKESDFKFGFESIITNTAMLDRMIYANDVDYVIGGRVFPASSGYGITVASLWGNGQYLDLPIFNAEQTGILLISKPSSDQRIDTVQVRGKLNDYDVQRRAFFNPELEVGQYFNVATKTKLITEVQIKQGTEGSLLAPDADIGWIKLAEIFLDPDDDVILAENIHNVSAEIKGEENTSWTNQKNRTFCISSPNDIKAMLVKAHTMQGEHRDKVIKTNNIDFGIGSAQVNAKYVPLGEEYTVGDDTFTSMLSVFETVKAESLIRFANDDKWFTEAINHADELFLQATSTGRAYQINITDADVHCESFTNLGLDTAKDYAFFASPLISFNQLRTINVIRVENTIEISVLYDTIPYTVPQLGSPFVGGPVKIGESGLTVGEFLIGEEHARESFPVTLFAIPVKKIEAALP